MIRWEVFLEGLHACSDRVLCNKRRAENGIHSSATTIACSRQGRVGVMKRVQIDHPKFHEQFAQGCLRRRGSVVIHITHDNEVVIGVTERSEERFQITHKAHPGRSDVFRRRGCGGNEASLLAMKCARACVGVGDLD